MPAMRLRNDFDVPLPVADTWALLTDIPRFAPCVPGARLDAVVDGAYRGGLCTTTGARYQGVVRFLERDEVDYRAVLEARGREERGGGFAHATIVAELVAAGPGTHVSVSAEVAVSGRAAIGGRSLLTEVSAAIMDEVAGRVEAVIRDGLVPADGSVPADEIVPADGLVPADGPAPGVLETPAPPRPAGAAPRGPGSDPGATGTPRARLLRAATVPAAAAVVAALLGWLAGRRGTPRH